MNGELARRNIASIERLPRPTQRAIDAAHRDGLIAAAHVHAAAYVTHVALTYTAQLSAEEARLIQQCPLGEARYKAIVDSFTGVAAAIIVQQGW